MLRPNSRSLIEPFYYDLEQQFLNLGKQTPPGGPIKTEFLT